MYKYSIYGPANNYGGSFGKADREAIYDPYASFYKTKIFEDKGDFGGPAPKQELKGLGLSKQQVRDIDIDSKNPAEMLPPDEVSIREADLVPDFKPMMLNIMQPWDFELHNQVGLVQDSRENYIKQANLYDNPEVFHDQNMINGSTFDKATAVSHDTAAGRQVNFLTSEDTSMNLQTSEVAF